MRRIGTVVLALALPTGALGQSIDFLSFDAGVGALGLSEIEGFSLRGGPAIALGLSYMSFGPDRYVGIGASASLLTWGGGGSVQIELGPGGAGDSSLHSPYFGIRLGGGSGTYTKEAYADSYGDIFELDNELSGYMGAILLGYRVMFPGFGVSLDVAPGVLYVTEQDPEVVEAEVADYLFIVEARLGFNFAMPL